MPSARIAPYIERYISQQDDLSDSNTAWQDETFPGPLQVLAERVSIAPDTLRAYLSGKLKTIDFDIADLLLCKMGMVNLWRHDLADLYLGTPISEKGAGGYQKTGPVYCLAEGCAEAVTFGKKTPRTGPKAKRYCSRACKNRQEQRDSKGHRALKVRLGDETCPHGHEWTAENTTRNNRGSRVCRTCKNGRSLDWYRRNREREITRLTDRRADAA